MATRAAFAMACFAGTLVVASAVASCGARTGLGDPDVLFDGDAFPTEGAPPEGSLSDQSSDGRFPKDARDDLPSIQVVPPDAPVFNPCPDAAATLIYVIGQSGTLYSYDPPAATFTPIGKISCPGVGATMPFSMAVDREGVAYVEFAEQTSNGTFGGNLYRVSTKTASCTPTAYDPVANGRVTYGMGFVGNAGDGGDAGETLFIAQQPNGVQAQNILATIDTTTFTVDVIRPFSSEVQAAELTGTGDGRLFAFYDQMARTQSSIIGQIDPVTAQVVADDVIALPQGGGWAFGFWGGAFYMFTAPMTEGPAHTIVTRFSLVDHTLVQEASLPTDLIVGAGVSTCAPSQ
jgi:hypothetical protein